MNRSRGTARLAATAALAVLLGLTACGADDDPAAGSAASGTSPAEDAFPVTLDTEFGTTTVEEAPERVVVLGLTDADAVLALGVTPVAVQQWLPQFAEYGVGPWAEDLIAEAVDGGETEVLPNTGVVDYDVEEVAALRPDLVVASSFTPPAQLAMLRRLGFPLLVVDDPGSPDAIRRGKPRRRKIGRAHV